MPRSKTFHLQTESQRKKIKPDKEPYYVAIHKGVALGFRKAPGTKLETWTARARVNGKYQYEPLGEVTPDNNYPEASRKAMDWETKLAAGFSPQAEKAKAKAAADIYTVRDLVKAYIKKHGAKKSENWRYTSNRFAKAYIYPSPIADQWLLELSLTDFEDIQDELLGNGLTGETVNRVLVPLRAAMNWGKKRGILTSTPWKDVPLCSEVGPREKKRSKHYFTQPERIAFVDGAPEHLQKALRFMLFTGCRPSEMRRVEVKDVDLENEVIHLGTLKGTTGVMRFREFPVLSGMVEFLEAQVKGRRFDDILLPTEKGLPWTEANLGKQIRKYREDNDLDPRWESMCFRHGQLTDWINAGIGLMDVASIAGTSVGRLEANYWKGNRGLAAQLAAVT